MATRVSSAISDSDLKQMIVEFSKPRPEFEGKSYVSRRREWFDKPMQSIRPLLMRDSLVKLTEDNAMKIYKEMSVGGPRLYPNTFVENGIQKIRTALAYLLYGTEPVNTRFYNFAGNPESDYRLSGIGRAFASTALFLLDHKEFTVWNSAVDGGLESLGMMPAMAAGVHLGDKYCTILKVMKELQKRCGFEDLSLADEFVELIFHGQLVLPENREIPPASTPPETPEAISNEGGDPEQHLFIQYCLVKIGLIKGHDVWVASNDKNKTYQGNSLASMTIDELPHFAGPDVLNIAKMIDVIWFKKLSATPICFFEIEHSTSIYSGLLRLNDVRIDYPVPKAVIVASPIRKALYERQIGRRTFVNSELAEVCQFLSYDDVKKLTQSSEVIKSLLF